MSNKLPHQGEIGLVDFNRKKVKEQSKIRPVLILSNNGQNQYNRYVVVAPLTSEKEQLKSVEPFEVMIEFDKENGLDYPSKALLHRLQAIDKELRLVEKMGKVNEKVGTQVGNSLGIVFTGKKLV